MFDTKLGGVAEKLQSRTTVQKDWRSGPQDVQQRQMQCPVLGAGDVTAGGGLGIEVEAWQNLWIPID